MPRLPPLLVLVLAAVAAPSAVAAQLLPATGGDEDPATHALLQNGVRPLDTDGNDVHAHGGCIIRINGTFYWYGESKKHGDPSWLSAGVSLYTSDDLSTWANQGLVLDGTRDVHGMPGPPPYRIERPKVLYNARYRYYVMMWHLDTPHFRFPAVGVATADSPLGPFRFRHALQPDGLRSFDMTLYAPPPGPAVAPGGAGDGDDGGAAYLVRSVENRYLGVTRLTGDYLNVTGGICSTAPRQEGMALWSAGGYHYVVSSHLTGWNPNPPLLYRAEAMCGAPWQELPVPAEGPGASTTFSGQPAYVLPYTFQGSGKTLFVWMGDRWNFQGRGSVGNATNLWLPLLPRRDSRGGYALKYVEQWTLSDYEWAAEDADARPAMMSSRQAAAAGLGGEDGEAAAYRRDGVPLPREEGSDEQQAEKLGWAGVQEGMLQQQAAVAPA